MKTLVAGVGNIFLGDDGFGVEVAGRLQGESFPEGVTVADFGIRGIHLAHELLSGYDALVLIDCMPTGEDPGTVVIAEVDGEDRGDGGFVADAHGFDPVAVLQMLRTMGGEIGRIYVVGCEPLDTSEGIGLSDPVAAAVDGAAEAVIELVSRLHDEDAISLKAGQRE